MPWEAPEVARWLTRLSESVRVIMFDKRGTGLSDRAAHPPGMDDRMDDARAVMDAVGIERAAMLGVSEGGSLASLFAASHPDRCQALILYGAFARFASWFPTQEKLERFFAYVDSRWGSGASMPNFAPSKSGDNLFQSWWGRFERLGASPAACAEIMRLNSQIDISDILPSIHVPTMVIHRKDDAAINIEGGRELARRIPGAHLIELPGSDHIPYVGDNANEILDLIVEFLTGSKSVPVLDRVLATVVFTDIVDSTVRADAAGDRKWRDMLQGHNEAVRKELSRFRGTEVKTLGDGFLATFDGPARAIHCAKAISAATCALGLPVRIGVHTGEVEIAENDVRGIAVHIASRVASLAKANEIIVSRTVKDLVAGSGLTFEDFGVHALKGMPDQWQLYRVT